MPNLKELLSQRKKKIDEASGWTESTPGVVTQQGPIDVVAETAKRSSQKERERLAAKAAARKALGRPQ